MAEGIERPLTDAELDALADQGGSRHRLVDVRGEARSRGLHPAARSRRGALRDDSDRRIQLGSLVSGRRAVPMSGLRRIAFRFHPVHIIVLELGLLILVLVIGITIHALLGAPAPMVTDVQLRTE